MEKQNDNTNRIATITGIDVRESNNMQYSEVIERSSGDATIFDRKYDHWKKQLLDLSKRNKMINYRETKRTTLKIFEPGFTELFNRLAVDEEELTFQRPIDKDSDIRIFSMLSLLETLAYPIPVHIGDIKADGSLLERRITLNNLRSKSKLARDEQGTNILYLSFGFIEWKEDNLVSAAWIKSPVLMMPVSLKMESIKAPFVLSRYDDEIEVNPTLDYLFNERKGVDLPTFELKDEKSIEEYMQTIEEISNKNGWKLTREVSLGLLSFLKISMYHDLDNSYDRALRNPVIGAITGNAKAVNYIPNELTNLDYDIISPNDCYQVVNADSSQQDAILLSKAGVSFVMQGPPGTGKSQTITNIIAEALADGKKILFVSEKAAALDVVYKRITEVGLNEFCLALHSHKANKKDVLNSIATNLKLERKRIKDSVMSELSDLFLDRQLLNQYARELHEEILPLEKSLYEVFGELTSLNNVPYIKFDFDSPASITAMEYQKMLYNISSYAKALDSLDVRFSENPWKGTIVTKVDQTLKEKLTLEISGLDIELLNLNETLLSHINALTLNEDCTWNGAIRIVSLFNEIERLPLFPANWNDKSFREKRIEEAKNANEEKRLYIASLNAVSECFNESIFNEDLESWLASARQIIEGIKQAIENKNVDDGSILNSAKNYYDGTISLIIQLESIINAYERGLSILPLKTNDTFTEIEVFSNITSVLFSPIAVKREWFDIVFYAKTRKLLTEALNHSYLLKDKTARILKEWEDSIFSIDADAMLSRFKTEYISFLKIFKSSYRADVKTIRNASRKIGVKFNDSEIISVLQLLREVNIEKRWFSDNEQSLNICFGSFYFGEKSDWIMIENGLLYIERVRSLFAQSIVPNRVIDLICNKSSHTEDYAELGKAVSVINKAVLTSAKADVSNMLPVFSEYKISDILPRANKLAILSKELLDLIQKIDVHSCQAISNNNLFESVVVAKDVINARKRLIGKHESLEKYFENRLNGLDTDWDSIISELEAVSAFFAFPFAKLMSEEFISNVCDNNNYRNKLSAIKTQIINGIAPVENKIKAFNNLFAKDAGIDDTNLADVSKKAAACLCNITLLDNWLACMESKTACDGLGLAGFTSKIEQSDNTIEDVVSVFKRGFYTIWVQSVIENKKAVEQFRRHIHDERIGRFVSLDNKQLFIARERIRQSIIDNIPDSNRIMTANDELSILQREISKKRRIMPLRKLFKEIPHLLLKLKPCLMMSPLSVAYFLEAKSYEFDTVIFDEASQIFPEDAIGAIIRGKQVIITGDSKQLPPSAFFKSTTSNSDDDYDREYEDEQGTEIYDSILEETAGVLPNRRLLWHYRSKHENLIAFSNQSIYNKELITFPSSMETASDSGVEFVYVHDGIYEGKGRNAGEARRCVELVKAHIEKHPARSLGIIAFSENQQKTILHEIHRFREHHPEYEHFFVEEKEDEFFVKNLENVQGDERDTIIFSISYAKTKEQRDNNRPMALRFGPLGQKGGERRLNVAITRAKHNVKLVSSIMPSDIDLSRTESEGVSMLRSYIDFALKGSATLHVTHSAYENDVFVDTVAEFILSNGYKIKKNLGSSSCKIDIAIVHPEKEDCYVAGIECDGFSYATAKTARDRDHLRKSVLEAMGWSMYRVWSPEWMARPEIERQKLLKFIDNTISNYSLETMSKEKAYANKEDFAESVSEKLQSVSQNNMPVYDNGNPYGFEYYVEANWQDAPVNDSGKIMETEAIKYIISIEQPISVDLLYQRMTSAYGNQKTTVTIRNKVDRVLLRPNFKGLIHRDEDDFITLEGFSNLKVRVPAPGSPARQVIHISPDELGLALITIASQAIGISSEQLIDAAAKVLGYARKGERVLGCLKKALEKIVKEGRVRITDGKVIVARGDIRG